MAQQQQRYRVIERIAAGGMAEVFRAESAGLEGFKKKVAIKRVLPHLSEKREFISMFLDEARLSAHLGHSNCVQVFDIGKGESAYFIVMEYVDGCDLKALIEYQRGRNQTFPVEESALICVRICEGLAYAHELTDENGRPLHIVHRDMSPPNVLITRFGEVKIVDFGLAKANSQLEQSQPGIIKGKFGYLSPEAALGRDVDARTDIFAVGIILWELLSGRRLFQGKSDLETVRMVQRAEVPDIRSLNPSVPASLAAVLSKSLAQNPAERYQTARDLGRDLNQVLFDLSRSVSSFDIANLIEPVQRERGLEKSRRAAAGSLIGNLIDQALFEFTSLQERETSAPAHGAAPLELHSFVGTMPPPAVETGVDWAESLGQNTGSKEGVGAPHFELGNLSALEDAPREKARSRAAAGGKSSGTAWLVIGVLALLGAGLTLAYAAGLVPPRLKKVLHLP